MNQSVKMIHPPCPLSQEGMELNACDQLAGGLQKHTPDKPRMVSLEEVQRPCRLKFGAIILKLRAPSSHLPPPDPRSSLGPGSSFTTLPTRREPGVRKRWPLGFAGKEMPIVVFIRLTPVSLPFDCCRPHTHSVSALGQETCVVLPTHLG